MRKFEVRFTKEAVKDVKKLTPHLKEKLQQLLTHTINSDPLNVGKKLLGDLEGFYSFRLSYKDRIIYSVDEKNSIIYIHRARTHYGD